MTLSFLLNGAPVEIGDVDVNTTLLQLLRARGLTGTKEGCGEGECGACAIVLTRRRDSAAHYEAVHACLTLAHSIQGQEVRTVEGVSDAHSLHPVQAALIEHGASQCGYCTPGFVMSLWAEYYREGRDAVDLAAISGNLCRCTGYRSIRDAARTLPKQEPNDPHCRHLQESFRGAVSQNVKLGTYPFYLPGNLLELWQAWRSSPEATLIAGGTDLVAVMNQRLERHRAFICLEQVQELRTFEHTSEVVRLGAALTLSELEKKNIRIRALEMLWPLFASPLVRRRATLGGNLGTASPIGDTSPVLLALDAQVELACEQGKRSLPLSEFFTGYRKTALLPKEIIEAVCISLPAPSFTRFYKVAKRVSDDISSVSAAFAFDFHPDRTISKARVAFGGVAERPLRLTQVEDALSGRVLADQSLSGALHALRDAISPIDDVRASARYRMRCAEALLRRAVRDGELQHPHAEEQAP